MSGLKIGILDDYQDVALTLADWSSLDATIEVFSAAFTSNDEWHSLLLIPDDEGGGRPRRHCLGGEGRPLPHCDQDVEVREARDRLWSPLAPSTQRSIYGAHRRRPGRRSRPNH